MAKMLVIGVFYHTESLRKSDLTRDIIREQRGGHKKEIGKNIPQNKTSLFDNLIW